MNYDKQLTKLMKAGDEHGKHVIVITGDVVSDSNIKLSIASNTDDKTDALLLALANQYINSDDNQDYSEDCECEFCEDMRIKQQAVPQELKDFVNFLNKNIH